MIEAFRIFLKKTFDIRDGELLRALLMQFFIFLIISVLLIIKPMISGLFLSEFGVESLPFAFILTAIAAAVVSSVYAKVSSIYSMNRVISGTLWFSVFSTIAFGLLLRFQLFTEPVLYILYIWIAIFALVSTSQFWVLANLIFNAREAKRLFGFIGAGAISGGIFGGYTASILTKFINSESLLFVCAGLLLICIPVSRTVWKKFAPPPEPEEEPRNSQKKSIRKELGHPLLLIKESRHLTYIALLVGLSVVVAKLVDYQFSGIAASVITDKEELTAFFGFWFSTFNVVSLVIQLFFTQRIVNKYGVSFSLLFLPGSILAATILLISLPQLLLAAVVLKLTDGSLKQSVNKAAMELLIMPVSQEVKKRTKIFIDVFVDSAATGLSGLLLIFLIRGLQLSQISVSILILVFVILWLKLATLVRKEYMKTFERKIFESNRKAKEKKSRLPDLGKLSVLGGIKKVFEKGEKPQILFLLGQVRELESDYFFEDTKKLLFHEEPEVRAAALQNLYFLEHKIADSEVKILLNDPAPSVKSAAVEYLFRQVSQEKVDHFNEYLMHDDYAVRYAALESLAKEMKDNPKLKAQLGVESLVESGWNNLPKSSDPKEYFYRKAALVKAIGAGKMTAFYPQLVETLHDSDPETIRSAIKAIGATGSPVLAKNIVRFLTVKNYKVLAAETLAKFQTAILPALRSGVKNNTFSIETVRRLPAIARRINDQEAVDFCWNLLKIDDAMVRNEALRALNFLKVKNPAFRFKKKKLFKKLTYETELLKDTLLITFVQKDIQSKMLLGAESLELSMARERLIFILKKRRNLNVERIFRFLALKYNPKLIIGVYQGFTGNNENLRAGSLDFLDNLLDAKFKDLIVPVIEHAMNNTQVIRLENINRDLPFQIPTLYQCFEMLLLRNDLRVNVVTLFYLGELRDPQYLPLAQQALLSKKPKIVDAAKRAIDKIEQRELRKEN